MDEETTRAGDPLAADGQDMGQDTSDATSMPALDNTTEPQTGYGSASATADDGDSMTEAGAAYDTASAAGEADSATTQAGSYEGTDDTTMPTTQDTAADYGTDESVESTGETTMPASQDSAAQYGTDENAGATLNLTDGADDGTDNGAGADDALGATVALDADAATEEAPRTGRPGSRNPRLQGGGGPRGGYGGQGSDMAALLAESEQQFRQLKYGDVLEGRIMRRDPDEMLVDIGSKSEGVIPMSEASSLTADELAALDVGSEVLVSVVQSENQEGHVVLSLDKARQERSWRNLQKKFEGGEILEAEVTGYNKGGLLVNLEGVRGFVPASQVSGLSSGSNESVKQSELSRYTGQRLPLKIIEINRNRNRLILSERQAAQEQRDHRKEQLLSELQPGQIREGMVSSICDFGAFVDIGGADGLIHLSELSWSRVNHPSEVLKVGQPVNVFVMNVDERDRKIALSLKRTQPEPWSTVMDRYQLGQLVRGTITQLTDFGAFARLEDGIEGLIHVSELAEGRVTHPRNVVQEGWQLTLRVIRIDPQRRRMGLSLKRAMEVQEGDTLPPQEALPIIPGRTPVANEGGAAAAEGGADRPAPAPRMERPADQQQQQQQRPAERSGDRPSDRGQRQDRPGDRGQRQDRGRGGRDGGYEPTPQMPAQPMMETSMAQAWAAAMEATAAADADEEAADTAYEAANTTSDAVETSQAVDTTYDAVETSQPVDVTYDAVETSQPVDMTYDTADTETSQPMGMTYDAADTETSQAADTGYEPAATALDSTPDQADQSTGATYDTVGEPMAEGTAATTTEQPETPADTYTYGGAEDTTDQLFVSGDSAGDTDSGTRSYSAGDSEDNPDTTTRTAGDSETS